MDGRAEVGTVGVSTIGGATVTADDDGVAVVSVLAFPKKVVSRPPDTAETPPAPNAMMASDYRIPSRGTKLTIRCATGDAGQG